MSYVSQYVEICYQILIMSQFPAMNCIYEWIRLSFSKYFIWKHNALQKTTKIVITCIVLWHEGSRKSGKLLISVVGFATADSRQTMHRGHRRWRRRHLPLKRQKRQSSKMQTSKTKTSKTKSKIKRRNRVLFSLKINSNMFQVLRLNLCSNRKWLLLGLFGNTCVARK